MSSATNFAWRFKGLFILCTGTAPLASELHPTLVGKAGDTEIHVCYMRDVRNELLISIWRLQISS